MPVKSGCRPPASLCGLLCLFHLSVCSFRAQQRASFHCGHTPPQPRVDVYCPCYPRSDMGERNCLLIFLSVERRLGDGFLDRVSNACRASSGDADSMSCWTVHSPPSPPGQLPLPRPTAPSSFDKTRKREETLYFRNQKNEHNMACFPAERFVVLLCAGSFGVARPEKRVQLECAERRGMGQGIKVGQDPAPGVGPPWVPS